MESSNLGPTLETQRLILRPPLHRDFDERIDFSADPDVMRFIGGVMTSDVAWRYMATQAGSWALLGYGPFSVIERASNKWIGWLGPWQPGDEKGNWPGTEIGWALTRSAWGKGYASEGAAAAIDWAIDRLGWTDIIHCIDPDNTASQKVAIALGSRNRGPGVLPPPMQDTPVDIWGQSAEQWREKRRTNA